MVRQCHSEFVLEVGENPKPAHDDLSLDFLAIVDNQAAEQRNSDPLYSGKALLDQRQPLVRGEQQALERAVIDCHDQFVKDSGRPGGDVDVPVVNRIEGSGKYGSDH
jgi:hypothetical protein